MSSIITELGVFRGEIEPEEITERTGIERVYKRALPWNGASGTHGALPHHLVLHDLVRLPLFFQVYPAREAQSPLFYSRSFLPPFPRSCTKWPFYQRFIPRHTRPRICCHSLIFIPTTVKWNTIWLCPYGVRFSIMLSFSFF